MPQDCIRTSLRVDLRSDFWIISSYHHVLYNVLHLYIVVRHRGLGFRVITMHANDASHDVLIGGVLNHHVLHTVLHLWYITVRQCVFRFRVITVQ